MTITGIRNYIISKGEPITVSRPYDSDTHYEHHAEYADGTIYDYIAVSAPRSITQAITHKINGEIVARYTA